MIDEPLLLYIAAMTQVVSATLVLEHEEPGHVIKVQRRVYSISEVLSNSKTHYPQVKATNNITYPSLMASENCRNTWRSLTLCSWQHRAYHQSGDE